MAPKRKKSTANVARKRPCRVIELETKLNVTVIVRQLGMSHFTIATNLKSRNKVTEAVKVYASLKTKRLTKIEKGQYQVWRNT
jgi:hypothetical protein